MMVSLLPGAWKGKKWKAEMRSILAACHRELEYAVESWPFCPIRDLPPLVGPQERRRHKSDLYLKDEMIQCAQKAGCSLTASRLQVAKLVLEGQRIQLPPPLAAAASSSSSSSSAGEPGSSSANPAPLAGAALGASAAIGAFAMTLQEANATPPLFGADVLRLRDQTDYHGPIMYSYLQTMWEEIGRRKGPLRVSMDGVQGDVMGELNYFWVISPARPWAGMAERSGFLPIQV